MAAIARYCENGKYISHVREGVLLALDVATLTIAASAIIGNLSDDLIRIGPAVIASFRTLTYLTPARKHCFEVCVHTVHNIALICLCLLSNKHTEIGYATIGMTLGMQLFRWATLYYRYKNPQSSEECTALPLSYEPTRDELI